MSEITIVEKPEHVSYEQLNQILKEAHLANQEKGLAYATAKLTAESLEKRIKADNGICFVAMDGGKPVGTMTVSFRKLHYWYHNGDVAIIKLVAVDSAYKGKQIASRLMEKCLEAADKKGRNVIVIDSAENNLALRRLALKYGFFFADYGLYAANNFYTTVYVKWTDGCPYSDFYRAFRYHIKRTFIRAKYKPGKINRFTGKAE